MNLSAPFIRRPIATTLLMIAILIFGIFSYIKLPVSDLPNIDYPTITVTARQPGGSPRYMADLVTLPLEHNLTGVSGVQSMTSSSSEGKTSITLHFDLDANLDQKEVEVQAAITAAMPELPPLPYPPTFDRTSPTDTPILFLLVQSETATPAELYYYAHNVLSQPIAMVEGVSKAEIYGLDYAIRIQADPMLMASYKVDFNELANALIAANPNRPAGKIRGEERNYLIESYSQIGDPKVYHDVIVKQVDFKPLFVGDLAKAIESTRSPYPFFKLYENGGTKNIAIIGVTRLPDSNTIAITKEIQRQLPELTRTIPGAIQVCTFFSGADQIKHAFYDVELTLLIALLLVVLVIFLYLGRLFEAAIPSVVLPLSLIATLIFMYLLHFNLDYLSLLALTLSIGFVIDDAIVVMENIVRHVELKKSPHEAALEGSSQISLTVLTMSIALSAVFIPFIFMPGIVGRILREFSVTIVVAIYCSGAIALILNPVLCRKFLKSTLSEKRTLADKVHQKFVHFYLRCLKKALLWKKTLLVLATLSILGSWGLVHMLHKDFFPPSNLDLIQGLILCDEGSSKRHTNKVCHQILEKILSYPFVQQATVASGYPEGDDQARFYVKLKEGIKRPSTTKIARMLMHDLSMGAEASVFAKPYPTINLQIGSDSSLGDYQYLLYSLNPKDIYPAAETLIAKMEQMPELVGVNHNMRQNTPQLQVHIDRPRAGIYNIDALEIESTLQYAYSGGRIATFSKHTDLHDLILEADPKYNLLTDDLDLLFIKPQTLQQGLDIISSAEPVGVVPLSSLATWKTSLGPAAISHYNSFPSVNISFSLAEGVALSHALEQIEAIAQDVLPGAVIASFQGTGKVFKDTFRSMLWLTVIAAIVIYLLLGILYESFLHPLTVLSALPLALFGGLATLWIFGQSLSLYGFVGLIVLIGLVQKNGIILIDFALEQIKEKRMTPLEAILSACETRFRPIMMTTVGAIAGAIPIAIGVGKYGHGVRPLGLVIVGGLLFSQLVTLFVTPIIFIYLEKVHALFTRKGQAAASTPQDLQNN